MSDFISKNKSKKDVSNENIDYSKESLKENSDDALFTNYNLSNSFDDYSINEMNPLFINIPSIESIENNFYGFEEMFNNNIIKPNQILSPSPPSQKLHNDSSDKNTMEDNFISRKKENPNNIYNEINNDIRKLKKNILNSSLNFINDKILKTFNYNIGNGINKKELFKIDFKHFNISRTDFNKQLLEMTLGEIFSYNIYGKITNCLPDFNKKLINNLLNEEDLKKRKIFEDLFSKTFLECIDQIIGKKRISELQGLERFFEKEIKSKKDGEALKELLNNYQEIISSKRGRKSKNVKKKIGDE
jgi:hypothetical protein